MTTELKTKLEAYASQRLDDSMELADPAAAKNAHKEAMESLAAVNAAKEEKSKMDKILDVVKTAVIPVATVIVGGLVTAWCNSRTIDELTEAEDGRILSGKKSGVVSRLWK